MCFVGRTVEFRPAEAAAELAAGRGGTLELTRKIVR